MIEDADEEMHRARYEGKLPCPLQAHKLPAPPCVHQPGSSLNPFSEDCSGGFNYVGMIDYIMATGDGFSL